MLVSDGMHPAAHRAALVRHSLRPGVCFDERPCQLLADSREPRPLAPRHPMRFDDEYTRHGTCNLFMMVEPFQGGGISA
jgi:hypothetical protein